ncbi:MAG: hypothetical protein Q9226_002871 [Calogaya cf. arnoldii]
MALTLKTASPSQLKVEIASEVTQESSLHCQQLSKHSSFTPNTVIFPNLQDYLESESRIARRDTFFFLKLLYTDTTLEDLTATLNHWQGTDFTVKDVSDFFTKHYNFAIRMREDRNWGTKPPFPRADVVTNAAYMWLNPTTFVGKWTEHDYNQPIRDLARYRTIYENFMSQLGKPVS